MELKRIDFEAGELIGKSGKKYTIYPSMSAARYAEFQILEKELAYGFTVKGIFDELGKINASLDKMKFVDSAVRVNNLMRGASKILERQPVIMKMCTLYINAEDENVDIITVAMMDAKIKDFDQYDIRDFFAVATTSVRGLIEIYETVTQTVLSMPVMGDQ